MKILIVEDNFETANNYRKYLNKFGYVSDICDDCKQAYDLIEKFSYDLILLDLNLKSSYGLDLVRYIKKNNINILTIVISAVNEQRKIIEVLNDGADDYINKPVDLVILKAKIEAMSRLVNKKDVEEITHRELKVRLKTKNVYIGDKLINLSSKEYDILEVLITHPGEVISKEMIANKVYDQFYDPSSTTLRVHIHNLKKKLNEDDIYLESIQKKGYRLC